jgi:hypothetical protein
LAQRKKDTCQAELAEAKKKRRILQHAQASAAQISHMNLKLRWLPKQLGLICKILQALGTEQDHFPVKGPKCTDLLSSTEVRSQAESGIVFLLRRAKTLKESYVFFSEGIQSGNQAGGTDTIEIQPTQHATNSVHHFFACLLVGKETMPLADFVRTKMMMKLLRSTLRTNVDLRFKAHGLILCVYMYLCMYCGIYVSLYQCQCIYGSYVHISTYLCR